MSQADLARVLGKSKAWVSQHAAMHALPDPIWGQRQQGQA
ncbi:KorB domain-containing protein [Achromobacter veterisilvae]|uniref:KorB domain-containing protein n=1 Tax=Achromobacter veterisilvae TaxID=2069367 RepID=A0ABZ2RZ62_9BURK